MSGIEGLTSLLVLAPHPDDEVIGCGGLIRSVLRAGGAVEVCVMSDGAASHPGSASFPPDRLRTQRRKESLAALAHLGLGDEHIHFLDLPDGGSENWVVPDALDALMSQHWDAVALPSQYDNHADHRATQAIGHSRANGAERLHYLVWPLESGERPPAPCLELDISEHRVRKAEALLRYESQLGMIRDADWNFAIDQSLFQRFTAPVEVFHS